jgi:streptogramin lyase
MHVRTTVTTLAAAAALLTAAASATAATEPLSEPLVAAHFSLAAGQQPENITVDRTGTAYLTFSFARRIVRLAPGGHAHVLATLPAPAKASTRSAWSPRAGSTARSCWAVTPRTGCWPPA